MRDPDYNQAAGNTYAQSLRSTFSGMKQTAILSQVPEPTGSGTLFSADTSFEEDESIDVMATLEQRAIDALRGDTELRQKLASSNGMPWFGVQQFLIDHLPEQLEDRRQFAYNLVSKAMNTVFGSQPTAWETFKNPATGKTWIKTH